MFAAGIGGIVCLGRPILRPVRGWQGFGLKREGIAIWYFSTIVLIANLVYNEAKIGVSAGTS